MSSKQVYWIGRVPTEDDFGVPIDNQFIDGRLMTGQWAIMAPATHVFRGMGLGTGKGQLYRKQDDGRWLKVEG